MSNIDKIRSLIESDNRESVLLAFELMDVFNIDFYDDICTYFPDKRSECGNYQTKNIDVYINFKNNYYGHIGDINNMGPKYHFITGYKSVDEAKCEAIRLLKYYYEHGGYEED